MDPNHIFVTFNLKQVLYELLVDVTVCMPHIGVPFIDVIFINSLEVVEQWPHELLIEENIFFNLFSFQPYWNAVLRLEEVIYLFLFALILRDNARPSYPLEAHEPLFFESKDGRVKEAPRLFQCKGSIFLPDDAKGQLK